MWQLLLIFLDELPEPLLTFAGSAEILNGGGEKEEEEKEEVEVDEQEEEEGEEEEEDWGTDMSRSSSTTKASGALVEGSFLGIGDDDVNTTVDLEEEEEDGETEQDYAEQKSGRRRRKRRRRRPQTMPSQQLKLGLLLAKLPNAHGNTLLSVCEMLATLVRDDENVLGAIADQVGPVAIRLPDGEVMGEFEGCCYSYMRVVMASRTDTDDQDNTDYSSGGDACEDAFRRSRDVIAALVKGARAGVWTSTGPISVLVSKRRADLQQLQVSVAQLSALASAACEEEDKATAAALVEAAVASQSASASFGTTTGLQGRRVSLLAELFRFGQIAAEAEARAKADALAVGKSADLDTELAISAAVAAAVSQGEGERYPLPPLAFALDGVKDDDDEDDDLAAESDAKEGGWSDFGLEVTVERKGWDVEEEERADGGEGSVDEEEVEGREKTESRPSPWKALGFFQGHDGVAALASR